MPALRERSASATVELGDGQSMGLAGLIDDNLREVVTKFPGLGDLPILGTLFRSNQFQKGQTELVILVTPRLAKPVAPGSVTLPTDKFVEPTDSEFYWGGQIEGSPEPPAATRRIEGGHAHDYQDHIMFACRRAALAACTGSTNAATATEADFGNSMASLIKAQTADPATAANPSTEPVTGVDPDYADNVIEAMRESVSKPAEVTAADRNPGRRPAGRDLTMDALGGRQRGIVAVVVAIGLLALLAMVGFALDSGPRDP